jgi:superfamily II DNA/RNA helicase
LGILARCGIWNPDLDAKLNALETLITKKHPKQKILVFTQFADTVHYLTRNLKARGVQSLEGVVGSSSDPTGLAWRFSPRSNDKKVPDEIRVLIATDVLSEGQNLQDAHIVVNFDLPWAIIRLIQRAGRVDRIGQQAESILCYSFLPADGVERIINLRSRVRDRLRQNAEVVGTDEQFFEDENPNVVIDIYNEKSGLLDGEADTEVDLASYAYQIWKNAVEQNPKLETTIKDLPNVVYAARAHRVTTDQPNGVLMYARTAQGNDALAWVGQDGQSVSQSQKRILDMAACEPDAPNEPRAANHHDLVGHGIALIAEDEKTVGGQLGKPSGARFKTYERLKRRAEHTKGSLFENQALHTVIDEIYRFPLRQSAIDTLNRQLKSGINDHDLEELVLALRGDDRLCIIQEDAADKEPQIICSLGLVSQ